jgi:hypothetical protein
LPSQPAAAAATSRPISNLSSLLRMRMFAPCLKHDTYPGTRTTGGAGKQMRRAGNAAEQRHVPGCAPAARALGSLALASNYGRRSQMDVSICVADRRQAAAISPDAFRRSAGGRGAG